jgi:RecA-family ATPase
MAVDIRPLSELMKRKPREELVENLLFKKGITTMVAQAGDGKTTTGASIALLVAAGGMWGGKKIDPRPVLWIAGEGEDDLPGMVKAVAKHHGLDWEKLDIAICLEAVDFSSIVETNLLIERLKRMPPMLIIADALADIMGDLDEDKAKHITQVYTNLRRVEKKTGSIILVLHHQGWNNDRERGSTAIRAKSDIMVQIVKEGFKPDEGYVKFTHLKRRGAPRLKEFVYEVKLVPVEGTSTRCRLSLVLMPL